MEANKMLVIFFRSSHAIALPFNEQKAYDYVNTHLVPHLGRIKGFSQIYSESDPKQIVAMFNLEDVVGFNIVDRQIEESEKWKKM